jgi:hypothetical protein
MLFSSSCGRPLRSDNKKNIMVTNGKLDGEGYDGDLVLMIK